MFQLRVQSNGYLQRMSSRKIVAEIPDPSVSSTPRRRPDPTAIAGGSHPLEGAEHNSQVSRKPKVPVKKNIVERARTETLSRPIAHSSSTVTRNTKRTSTTQATEENATAPRPFQVRPASAPRATVSQRELQSVAPRQTVVRRVHAVLEVPIKEESEDENEEAVISDAQSAGSNYEPTPSRRTSLSKNAQQTKARQGSSTKGKQVSRTDEYTDEEEDAIEETVTHARHNRTPRRIEQVSDDEDELILGAEVFCFMSLPLVHADPPILQDYTSECLRKSSCIHYFRSWVSSKSETGWSCGGDDEEEKAGCRCYTSWGCSQASAEEAMKWISFGKFIFTSQKWIYLRLVYN